MEYVNPSYRTLCSVAVALLLAAPAVAQRRVTLEDAIAAAVAAAPTVAAARADSAAARAELSLARTLPDPALLLGYSRSAPRNHIEVEQPLEYPWVRSARIRAAATGLDATHLLVGAELASVRYRVEVAYAQAAGAAALHQLSRQNVENGRELVQSVRARMETGDASELDVELAEVTFGQIRSAALGDSLQALQANLALQSLMGVPLDSAIFAAADPLEAVPLAPPDAAAPLRVSAAERQLASREASLLAARRSQLPSPAVQVGIEQGDPAGDETGVLPMVGITVTVPLFGAKQAEVARARAERERARAELAAARRETAAALAAAGRARDLAVARTETDREAASHAERVARLSATAFREGAYPLATVLEAQRNAREAQRQYLDDLIASRIAMAAYRLASTGGGASP
jgi:cobalt-zinc-cadmium efflux system outer membrane protein